MRDRLGRWITSSLVALLFTGLAGCDDLRSVPGEVSRETSAGAENEFDVSTVGAIHGRVVWQGDLPEVGPYEVRRDRLTGTPLPEKQSWPNPLAPVIDPQTR